VRPMLAMASARDGSSHALSGVPTLEVEALDVDADADAEASHERHDTALRASIVRRARRRAGMRAATMR
jgi:hypothetical protein